MNDKRTYREPWENEPRKTNPWGWVVAIALAAAMCLWALSCRSRLSTPVADEAPAESDAAVVASDEAVPSDSANPTLAPQPSVGDAPVLTQTPPAVDSEKGAGPNQETDGKGDGRDMEADEETTYELTIVYQDKKSGGQLLPSYVMHLKAGEHYSVVAPLIDGYRADPAVTEGWMPKCNVHDTTFYVPLSG